MRIVSILFITYKIPRILICWTARDASLTKPTTLTLRFPSNSKTLMSSFTFTFNYSFYVRSLEIADIDAPVSNNIDRDVPFNLI